MQVILSGGDLGGQVVEWDEAEETMVFEAYRYRKVNGIAVYEGLES